MLVQAFLRFLISLFFMEIFVLNVRVSKLMNGASQLFVCKKEQLEVHRLLLSYKIHMILILS